MAAPGNYQNSVAITPSDTAVLNPPPVAFMIIGAVGTTCKVRTIGGQDIAFGVLTLNTIYPFKIDKVYATGTTATGIVGLS